MVRSILGALGVFALVVPAQSGTFPLADPEQLVRRLREAILLDYELQADYTYLERRRDVKISRLGKVSVGPLRTFEVYPSANPGETYKRLIAVDGKPLDPEELARRDEKHLRDLREAAERRRAETPEERARREKKRREELQEREDILDDAMAVFQLTVAGREYIGGEPVLVVDLSPRRDAPVKTRHGRWMKSFEGRMWVATDYQIAKLDVHAREDLTIGWGIIGRVHKGSRLVFTRTRVDDRWLPAESHYDVSGTTLLFRRFDFAITTTYSDYKKLPEGEKDRMRLVPSPSSGRDTPSTGPSPEPRHAALLPRASRPAI